RKKKTKFPIARVKKIIQSNEEIGKLSISAPVVVSKAAELFIEDLVLASLEQVRKDNRNRITIDDIKRVVYTIPKFDFLK
ncbi:Transcription factor CBF/NF-Y/archaeal histone domain, partial [Trinorchestia longiramus]